MKRKTYVFILALTLLSFYVYSQQQESNQSSNLVQIMDLSVLPVIMPALPTALNDSVFIEVVFKINNTTLVSKAIYLFGTAADTSDVLSVETHFVNQSGNVFLQSSYSQKQVIGYDARVVLGLSKQQSIDFKYLSVYVQKENGQISNKLYFQNQ